MRFFSRFHPEYDRPYFATHFRFPAWLIGFIAGYILCEFPQGTVRIPKVWWFRRKLPSCFLPISAKKTLLTTIKSCKFVTYFQKLNRFVWMCLLIAMPAIVIGNCENHQIIPKFNAFEFGLFEILSRIVWSISMTYIIFACVQNSGGHMNSFLSHPIWQPLSKLSYTIYLVHLFLLKIIIGSTKTAHSFSEMQLVQNCITIFVLSAIVAIPLALAFEVPIGAIHGLVTASKKRKNSTISSSKKPLIDTPNFNNSNYAFQKNNWIKWYLIWLNFSSMRF